MINTLLPTAQPANAGGGGLTDEQIAQLRQYSQALQGNQQPVHAWTQGLSNLTGDIVGALQKRRADDALKQRTAAGDDYTRALAGGQPQPPMPAYATPPTSPITAAPLPAPAASASPPVQAPPYAQPNQNWQGATPAPYMAETDPSNMSTG